MKICEGINGHVYDKPIIKGGGRIKHKFELLFVKNNLMLSSNDITGHNASAWLTTGDAFKLYKWLGLYLKFNNKKSAQFDFESNLASVMYARDSLNMAINNMKRLNKVFILKKKRNTKVLTKKEKI